MKKFSEWLEKYNEGRVFFDDYELPKGPFVITPERAREIWKEGNKFQNWSKICTKEEDEYIASIMEQMPGQYSWMDALFLIMNYKK